MTRRTRRTVALCCIGLIIFAAFSPAAATAVGAAVLVPLGSLFAVVQATIVRVDQPVDAEQPLALFSTAAFRAPPSA